MNVIMKNKLKTSIVQMAQYILSDVCQKNIIYHIIHLFLMNSLTNLKYAWTNSVLSCIMQLICCEQYDACNGWIKIIGAWCTVLYTQYFTKSNGTI